MGNGLKQANLMAVCSREPWGSRGPWGGSDPSAWTLTGTELAAFYAAVPEGKIAMCAALGVASLGHRKADRALSLLKKAGLITYACATWTHA